jgi:hypothetical protein
MEPPRGSIWSDSRALVMLVSQGTFRPAGISRTEGALGARLKRHDLAN